MRNCTHRMLYEKVHGWVDSPNYWYTNMLMCTVAHHNKSKKKSFKMKNMSIGQITSTIFLDFRLMCQISCIISMLLAKCLIYVHVYTFSSFDKASYTGVISLIKRANTSSLYV